jgi:DNA-binding MarR family transcriptional regulator
MQLPNKEKTGMTNMQDTSLLAYNQININRRQQQIMEVFWKHPTCTYTNRELGKYLGWEICSVTGRVKELRGEDPRFQHLVKHPLLEKASRRVCNVTGNLAWSWKIRQP